METKVYEIVDSVQKLEEAIARTREAQKIFATYTQEKVDKIFLAAASAANKARIPLAKIAVEVGFVVGITAATTPMGSAIFLIPKALSSSITPQVLVSLYALYIYSAA